MAITKNSIKLHNFIVSDFLSLQKPNKLLDKLFIAGKLENVLQLELENMLQLELEIRNYSSK